LTKTEKITSIGQLKSLTSDYNYLIMSAQILDANGAILWEYPNFRQRIIKFDPLLNLEYPDFNEAEANLTTSANVKFKTLEGIRRALEQRRKDLLMRETQESEVYNNQFDEIISLLKYDPDKEKKSPPPVTETSRPLPPVEQPTKALETAPPQAPTTQNAPTPTVEVPAVTRVPVLEKPVAPTDEIAPAKGSTL
jgi:hypothetical protein